MREPFGDWYATSQRDTRPTTTGEEDAAAVGAGRRVFMALAVLATIALIACVVLLALFAGTSGAAASAFHANGTFAVHAGKEKACPPG